MTRTVQRTFGAALCLVLASGLLVSPLSVPAAYAAESDDLAAEAAAVAATSAQKQAEADSIASNIDALQTNLNQVQAEYDTAQQEYETAKAAAEDAAERVKAAEKRTAELQERLGGRAVDMYKTGGSMSFLEVLLGAASFDEFLTSWDALGRISQQDADMVQEAKEVRAEAAAAQAEFTAQSEKAASEMEKAQVAKQQIETTKASMESELAKMSEEIALLQGQEEFLRISAEEAKEREAYAAEVARQANLAAISGGSSSGGSGNANAGTSGGNGSVSISGWVHPCPSYYGVTCEFGYSPITGSHTGIDLGAAEGSPILAAGPGTVTYVGWYGTGGNAVIISHGNGVRTVYMHQSRTAASVGQSVNAGDVIGYVGTTGLSTGPHLHFNIEINGTPVNPRNYYSF